MKLKPELIKATLADYPIIEHMWRFYIYDMGRYCGFNKGWECPTDLSFVPDDLTPYFVDPTRKAFFITIEGALAGFVLLHKVGTTPDVDWNVGEFFILAKFQGKGIGEQIAAQIFKEFPGIWEVSVIPENTGALSFWRKVISNFTGAQYSEEIKHVDYDKDQPKRYILRFDTKVHPHPKRYIQEIGQIWSGLYERK
ncbi:MAG: GNAT family N-acetyltransferase [Bacillota bacterium]|nr:GNAT family N-acetyltransferase [Bacillota bacterium]